MERWREWREIERWAERGERKEGGEMGLGGSRLRDELRVDR